MLVFSKFFTSFSKTIVSDYFRYLIVKPGGMILITPLLRDLSPPKKHRNMEPELVTCTFSKKKSRKNPFYIWVFPKIVVPPKSSILIGFSIINHPFWGTIIFGNTHMSSKFFCKRCLEKEIISELKLQPVSLWGDTAF